MGVIILGPRAEDKAGPKRGISTHRIITSPPLHLCFPFLSVYPHNTTHYTHPVSSLHLLHLPALSSPPLLQPPSYSSPPHVISPPLAALILYSIVLH